VSARIILFLTLGLVAATSACARTAGPPPTAAPATAAPDPLDPARLGPLRTYIKRGWALLTRSNRELPEAAADPKFPVAAGAPLPVYYAASDRTRVTASLQALLGPQRLSLVDLRPLPANAPETARPHGLLYLPEPYVVPGGRFNEMYGWDSYFILLGLLRDGQVSLARGQTDNFLYEIERYGKVLNANRTYYLTRSQPPLLAPMVRAVFAATGDRDWLARALPALEQSHRFWTSPPHLAGDTGLSRYYDVGQGPAPEVVSAERDAQGKTHYDRVRAFYREQGARIDAYPVDDYYDRKADALTPTYYVGDRSMRESGFDPSERWGPFGVAVIHHAPVCLNVLLYVLETDLADLHRTLGHDGQAARWLALARERGRRIDRYLWDDQAGLYFDWSVARGARRAYPFATTFWPLWAGLASPEQAARVRGNLPLFERPGGVRTSSNESGSQWDAPFGWAPLQLFAVRGLERAGFVDDARRLARAFVTLVIEDFERRGAIVEKFDVDRRSSDVEHRIRFGYSENVVGFGWTNGVVLELLPLLGR
jgi:alpha,alpha-trehalase